MAVKLRDLDFGQPDPIPDEAQELIGRILTSGRLFRYQGKSPAAAARAGASPASAAAPAARSSGHSGGGSNEGVEPVDVDSMNALCESAMAEYLGVPYALGVNSGGCALFLALKSCGVQRGDVVLTNAYTLSPVPGAIVHAGGTPVFVDCDPLEFSLSLDDLQQKCSRHHAKFFLLSYMRGRLPDMDAVQDFLLRNPGVTLIEDCAHSLGAVWGSREGAAPGALAAGQPKKIGTFGTAAVFSFQTNKLINAGEGGFVVMSDEKVAARAIVLSGSYGHFSKNGARPDVKVMEELYTATPNFSMRMSAVVAAVIYVGMKRRAWVESEERLRNEPALAIDIDQRVALHNKNWLALLKGLWDADQENCWKAHGFSMVDVHKLDELVSVCLKHTGFRVETGVDNADIVDPGTQIVGTSFQFLVRPEALDVPRSSKAGKRSSRYRFLEEFSRVLTEHGVTHAWYGRERWVGFVSTYKDWHFARSPPGEHGETAEAVGAEELPLTEDFLSTLFDVPLYHTLRWERSAFAEIGAAIHAVAAAMAGRAGEFRGVTYQQRHGLSADERRGRARAAEEEEEAEAASAPDGLGGSREPAEPSAPAVAASRPPAPPDAKASAPPVFEKLAGGAALGAPDSFAPGEAVRAA